MSLDVEIVRLLIQGVTFNMSPGCSVTQSYSKDVRSIGKGDGTNEVYYIPTGSSHTIRIDAKISAYGADESDGKYEPAGFDPYALVFWVQSTPKQSKHTLYWRGNSYEGLVKNVTVTQRSGEGDYVDVAVIFDAGNVSGAP